MIGDPVLLQGLENLLACCVTPNCSTISFRAAPRVRYNFCPMPMAEASLHPRRRFARLEDAWSYVDEESFVEQREVEQYLALPYAQAVIQGATVERAFE